MRLLLLLVLGWDAVGWDELGGQFAAGLVEEAPIWGCCLDVLACILLRQAAAQGRGIGAAVRMSMHQGTDKV